MRLVGMRLSTREEEPGSFTVEQWGTAGEPMRFEDFYLSQLPSTVALARALSRP